LRLRKYLGIVLCLFLTLALFVSVPNVHALENTRSPGTVTSVQVAGMDRVWNDPNNVKVSDDQRARATNDLGSVAYNTYRLKCTNFGFNLPNNAIIKGIMVEIERYRGGINQLVYDEEIFIIKSDGSLGSNNKADTSTLWPSGASNEAYRAYGGGGDLWSESWTASDINDPDFGVSIRADVGHVSGGTANAYIDHVRITVYYTPARPILQSIWTDKAPTINGVSSSGEWFNLVIFMKPPSYPIEAYVYMMNDNNWLYVLVDAVGDTTDDAYDECLLMFDYDTPTYIRVNIVGASGTTKSNSYLAAVGYGPSPHSSGNHKIYEFKIPLSHVNLVPGGSVDFCSPEEKYAPSIVYDSATGRDNIWPYWLSPSDESTWGLLFASLRTAGPAVGGYYMEVNRLAILAPYVMFVVGLLGLVYAVKRRR
jgi:hypothetical protein